MSEQLTPAQILRRSLDLMNNEGAHWTQDTWSDLGGPNGEVRYCSVGAINKIAGEHGYEDLRYSRLRAIAALGENIKDPYEGVSSFDKVIEWNDDPERTWPEVKACFESAIHRLEGGAA